jgi:hypothetical protein
MQFERSVMDGFGIKPRSGGGRFAESIVAGTLIDGKRVIGKVTGRTNGRAWSRVKTEGGRWSDTLWHGTRVAGTRQRTDLPAGPLSSGGGGKVERSQHRDKRRAFHIDNVIYA